MPNCSLLSGADGGIGNLFTWAAWGNTTPIAQQRQMPETPTSNTNKSLLDRTPNNPPTQQDRRNSDSRSVSPAMSNSPVPCSSGGKNMRQAAMNNSRSSSPSVKDPNLDIESPGNESDKSKKTQSLKRCPCGISSGGKAWVLKCTGCTQTWHNSCANLKGNIPKNTIDQLDHWLCPWCYVSPYLAPSNHKSVKNSSALTNIVSTDSVISQIEEAIQNCVVPQNSELLNSIQSSLNQLSQEIKDFAGKTNAPTPTESQKPPSQGQIKSISPEPTPNENIEPPFQAHTENFISEEEAENLKVFFESERFTREGSREVASYGTVYKYMGAKSTNPKPIPEALQPLVDRINFGRGYAINQILVNKFEGPDSALPKHSDNEYDINPSSEIITVSLGDSATLKFSEKYGNHESEITVCHRSMYSMTRSSQNIYDHQIASNPQNTLRFSITMRCIHWTHLNSLYAVGDSNFGHIKFGEGRGTIGKATPGQKDFAACVEDIIPEKTMSFKNIVTMCGTNNLKAQNANVMEIYQKYKGKLEEIRRRSPRSNIFVCPVLPSRDHQINERVFEFNRLLFEDLVHSNLRISLVRGLNVFLDKNFLLKSAFHDKRSDSDVLHINNFGYSSLVRCIKTALFGAKTKKEHTGGQHSSSAWGPPRH